MKRIVLGLGSLVLASLGCESPQPEVVKQASAVEAKKVEQTEAKPVDEPGAAVAPRLFESGPLPWNSGAFSFVIQLGSRGTYLILEEELPDSWKADSVRSINRETSAEADLVGGVLSPEDKKLLGQTVTLYGKSGELCQGQATRVVGLSRAMGVEFQLPVEEFDYEKASDQDFANMIWEHGNKMLAIKLDVPANCDSPIWARDSALPAPTLWTTEEPSNEEKAELTRKLKLLPGYIQNQADYVRYATQVYEEDAVIDPTSEPDWGTLESAEWSYRVFRGPDRDFAQVLVQGEVGCGGPDTEFAVIFERHKGASDWTPITDTNKASPLFFAAVTLDVNLDGIPEFVANGEVSTSGNDLDRQLLQRDVEGYRITRSTEFPYFGCRC